MTAPSLRLCRALGARGSNLEQYPRADGIRALFTTCPRKVEQTILSVPFSSVLSPLLHPNVCTFARFQLKCANQVAAVATRHTVSSSGKVAMGLTQFEVCAAILFAAGRYRHEPHVVGPSQDGAFCQTWHAYIGTCPEFEHVHDAALPVEASDQIYEAHHCQEVLAMYMHDVCIDPEAYGLCFRPEDLFPVMRGPQGTVISSKHEYWRETVLQNVKWALWASRSRTLFIDAPACTPRILEEAQRPSHPAMRRSILNAGLSGSSTRSRRQNTLTRFPVIAPMVDWLNHGTETEEKQPNCEARFDVWRRSVDVVALRDIPNGEELCIKYLAPPSIDNDWWGWFLQYGFLPERISGISE